jgi:hypothetical protein
MSREAGANCTSSLSSWGKNLASAALVVGILVCQIRPNPKAVFAGDTAPSFSLLAAQGGRCELTDLLARKRVVLLSFIDAGSQPLSRTYSDPSRAQLVFLKSIARQYAPNGVEVLIVGCNGLLGGQPLTSTALLNFTYDWQLDGVTVLRDDDAGTAFLYGVSTLPTTLLIASDGRIQRRWDGFVAPAQLALALECLVGPRAFGDDSAMVTDLSAEQRRLLMRLERGTGIEPATSSLGN